MEIARILQKKLAGKLQFPYVHIVFAAVHAPPSSAKKLQPSLGGCFDIRSEGQGVITRRGPGQPGPVGSRQSNRRLSCWATIIMAPSNLRLQRVSFGWRRR